jgi:prepilin-type N-terminal cleavage/methylation domain-containing protein
MMQVRHRNVEGSEAQAQSGFTLTELLATLVIAAIFFAAMIPFFINALKRTSADRQRVDANLIAQDRMEQIRLLRFTDITQANLNLSPSPAANPFGDGRFGPTYTLYGQSRPYSVTYHVQPTPAPTSLQKYVEVRVTPPDSGFVTTAHTIVRDEQAGITSVTEAEPTDLALTVYFDKYQYVIAPGVTLQRVQTNVTPNVTSWMTPDAPPGAVPTATNQTVTFSGLTGGPNYTYSVFCRSKKASYTLAAPPFRLWKNGRLKFDTYPGGD